MPYKLAFTQKPTYLHAVVTGPNKPDTVRRYLERVRRECKTRGCNRVLIEEHLEGPRLGTMDVFQIVAEESGRAQGFFEAVAYVDVNTEGDSMKFAETVAVNRGIPVRVFASVGDAEQWLLSKERGSAPPDTPPDADRRAG